MIYACKDGEIYYCSTKGIIKWDGNRTTNVLDIEKLIHKEVISLNFDSENNLWIGTLDGVYSYNLITKSISNSLFIGVPVSKVFEDNEQNYWVTTIGKGTLLFSHGFQYVSIKSKLYGLSENEITSLDINNQNGDMLFAARPNLIYTLKKDNKIISTRIDTIDKLTINKLKIIRNDLWFITQNNNLNVSYNFQKKTTAITTLNTS